MATHDMIYHVSLSLPLPVFWYVTGRRTDKGLCVKEAAKSCVNVSAEVEATSAVPARLSLPHMDRTSPEGS